MIGERLQERRKDFNDTQADLARKLNVSVSTIKSWERENSAPSHEMLVEICTLYHVSADFLLGITDNDPWFRKEQQDKLTPQNKEMVQLFEEFMLYKQQKETKK